MRTSTLRWTAVRKWPTIAWIKSVTGIALHSSRSLIAPGMTSIRFAYGDARLSQAPSQTISGRIPATTAVWSTRRAGGSTHALLGMRQCNTASGGGANAKAPGGGGAGYDHDRNIASWKPAHGENPPKMPEEQWRSLAEYAAASSKSLDHPAVLRKRLLWSCKKRGWAEMEVLLTAFASRRLAEVPDEELARFNRILLSDDLFLMALLTGKKPPPEEFKGVALDMLLNFVDEEEWRPVSVRLSPGDSPDTPER